MFAPTKFTPAARPPLRKPPPLDFAQLIAQRRASRVAQNTQIQADTNHFWNLKNSIELENAFQEKERMAVHLRLGRVPAHISYPIFEALHLGARRAMEVDEAVQSMEVDEAPVQAEIINPRTGCVEQMGIRDKRDGVSAVKGKINTTKALQERIDALKYTRGEYLAGLDSDAGVEHRAQYPEDRDTRNVKTRAKNAIVLEGFRAKPPRRK